MTQLKRMTQLARQMPLARLALLAQAAQGVGSSRHARGRVPPVSGEEWLTGPQAARLLDVSRSTMLRTLKDPDARRREWGEEGEGWRYKPLSTRGVIQVSRAFVDAKLQPRSSDT